MLVHATTAYRRSRPLEAFVRLAETDAFGEHRLTSSAASADVVLFVESARLDADPLLLDVVTSPLRQRFRDRALLFSGSDLPHALVPGLAPSADSRTCSPRRVKSFGYVRALNPYIAAAAREQRSPRILYGFVGSRTAPVRRRVLALHDPRACLRDTTGLRPFVNTESKHDALNAYAQELGDLRFVLCPRGVGTGSFRLFEAMELGRCPVILSDHWPPTPGVPWQEFALFVRESEVDTIPDLLRAHESEWADRGRAARVAWEAWFGPETFFHRAIETMRPTLASAREGDPIADPSFAYAALRFGFGATKTWVRGLVPWVNAVLPPDRPCR